MSRRARRFGEDDCIRHQGAERRQQLPRVSFAEHREHSDESFITDEMPQRDSGFGQRCRVVASIEDHPRVGADNLQPPRPSC